MRHARLLHLISGLAFLGYLVIGRALANLYPFSTFNMYSTERLDSASRIVALDPAGVARELDEYGEYDCPAPLPIAPTACPAQWPFYYVPYLDRKAARELREHTGAGSEPVTIIRRVFRLTAAEPTITDCVLLLCHAVPR